MLDVAYCITAIVHGDIRHLERTAAITALSLSVHGDIRHLEKLRYHLVTDKVVHGDIRHLEISANSIR